MEPLADSEELNAQKHQIGKMLQSDDKPTTEQPESSTLRVKFPPKQPSFCTDNKSTLLRRQPGRVYKANISKKWS